MIRTLLIVLGGWAAWRYRSQIKEYVQHQLPHVRARGAEALDQAKAGLGREGKAGR
jgi:hypothetical protein